TTATQPIPAAPISKPKQSVRSFIGALLTPPPQPQIPAAQSCSTNILRNSTPARPTGHFLFRPSRALQAKLSQASLASSQGPKSETNALQNPGPTAPFSMSSNRLRKFRL